MEMRVRRQLLPSGLQKSVGVQGVLIYLSQRKVFEVRKMGKTGAKCPKKEKKVMKLREKIKRFWTLDVHDHEGFTLVELIIVIAILAILSSVAVVGYSSYVKKANMQADKTLVEEIKNALMLAYYSDPDFKGGVVVLSLNNEPTANGLEDVMKAAFGDNWKAQLKLKHNGWSADFQGSSFAGSEEGLNELVGTVDKLTGALAAALNNYPTLAGDDFLEYAAGLGAEDAMGKGNAAVFYVADLTGQMTLEDINAANEAMIEGLVYGSGSAVEKSFAAMNGMNQYTGGSTVSSMALMYAMATGFSEYYNTKYANNPEKLNAETNPKKILDDATEQINQNAQGGTIQEAADAFGILAQAFNEMLSSNPQDAQDYRNNAMGQDAAAYADAMKTVSASKDSICATVNGGSLSMSGYFSDSFVRNLLAAYSEGGVFVFALPDENGVMQFTSTLDKQ